MKLIAFFLLFLPVSASAQLQKLENPTPKGGATLPEFIDLLISIMQSVLVPVVVVCIIYSGYLLVSAGGNEEQVKKAKMWIVWTLVGTAILLGAKVIAEAIKNTMGLF